MTKREFDAATKENWGGRGMASDVRCSYRERRMREHDGCGAYGPRCAPSDYIARRAWEMQRVRRLRYPWEPALATLGVGSKFRAGQAFAARQGWPLLGTEGRPRWAGV